MAEPTDDELKNVIRVIVKKVDLDMCGIKKFTKILSKECGLDLSHKSKFIKKILTDVINEDDQEEETSDEEEIEEEKPPTKKQKKKKGDGGAKGGGGGGLAAQKEISAELAAFLGKGDKMARTDIVKELWAYIRENDLQNPDNKREILLDDRMKAVFGCDNFTMFTMNKYIGAHIHPFKPVDLTSSNPKKRKAPKEKKEAKKKRKGGGSNNSGLQAPYQLSPELARVVGKQILPRPQVTKKLWAYIRANDLQVRSFVRHAPFE